MERDPFVERHISETADLAKHAADSGLLAFKRIADSAGCPEVGIAVTVAGYARMVAFIECFIEVKGPMSELRQEYYRLRDEVKDHIRPQIEQLIKEGRIM